MLFPFFHSQTMRIRLQFTAVRFAMIFLLLYSPAGFEAGPFVPEADAGPLRQAAIQWN
jgi:hypothetical protein